LLPALSYHFHLRPADVYGLTPEELDGYLDVLKEIQKAK
jgi:hypothetical protein